LEPYSLEGGRLRMGQNVAEVAVDDGKDWLDRKAELPRRPAAVKNRRRPQLWEDRQGCVGRKAEEEEVPSVAEGRGKDEAPSSGEGLTKEVTCLQVSSLEARLNHNIAHFQEGGRREKVHFQVGGR